MTLRTVTYRVLAIGILVGVLSLPARSQMEVINIPNDDCGCTCVCILPWLVADRFDDQTNIPGYPQWNQNGRLDRENFTDSNGDDLWQPGEDYNDENNNRAYDMEFYHPLITGYTSDRDRGEPIVVRSRYENSGDSFRSGVEILFSGPGRRGSTPTLYMQSILGCSDAGEQKYPHTETRFVHGNMDRFTATAVREIISKDPDAYFSEPGLEVLGSKYEVSPRVGLLAFRDPRTTPKQNGIPSVVKFGAVFIESVDEHGVVIASFMRLGAPGFQTCRGSTADLFEEVLFEGAENLDLDADIGETQGQDHLNSTWGRIKAIHR